MNQTKTTKWASNCFWFSGVITFLGLYFSISLMWVGLALFFLAGFALAISSKTWAWLYRNPLFWPVMILCSAMTFSVIVAAPYPYKGAIGKIIFPFFTFLFSWFFSIQPKTRKDLLKTSAVLSVVLAIVSATQGLGFFPRFLPGLNPYLYQLPGETGLYLAVGLTRHHTTFAFTLILLFHILFAHGLLMEKTKQKALFLLFSALCVAGTLFTFSRGAWLSLVISSALVLLLVNWKKLLWGCALFVALFSTLFFTVSAFQKRISSLDLAANQERLELWKVGWKMFQDSPWFGQGYDSFGYRLPQFSDLHITSPSTPLDLHNMYLEFLATSGILGFLCFLLFLGASFRLVFSKIQNSASAPHLKPWFLASAGVLTAFSIGGFFDRYFDMPHTVIPMVLMLGLCTASKPDEIVADL